MLPLCIPFGTLSSHIFQKRPPHPSHTSPIWCIFCLANLRFNSSQQLPDGPPDNAIAAYGNQLHPSVESTGSPVPVTRYFVIRAPKANFEMSLKSGLWATHKTNEAKLVNAYKQTRVALIFCPVLSNKLQGVHFSPVPYTPFPLFSCFQPCP